MLKAENIIVNINDPDEPYLLDKLLEEIYSKDNDDANKSQQPNINTIAKQ